MRSCVRDKTDFVMRNREQAYNYDAVFLFVLKADRDNRIFTQGCDDALYRWLVGNYAVLGGVAAGILILQASVYRSMALPCILHFAHCCTSLVNFKKKL